MEIDEDISRFLHIQKINAKRHVEALRTKDDGEIDRIGHRKLSKDKY